MTVLLLPFAFMACNKDDIDKGESIYVPTEKEGNAFDKWLKENYVYPYNVEVKYLLDDNETDVEYDLVPADYDKAFALAKIVKYVWMEAYDEVWGIQTTRTYVPKLIQMIGNVAYTESGMILGQAEGGMKVMLFRVNDIDVEHINMDEMNEYYFKTMHHEFTHILNQTKPYNMDYERISESDYVGSDWYRIPLTDALHAGFISSYAMDRASEDFAEMMAIYVTNTPEMWEAYLQEAGQTGRPIIEKKFDMVYAYMRDSWNVDLNKLRSVVLRRQNEITSLDLSTNE